MVEIGDKIKILNANGQYSKWVNKTWIVKDVAYSGRGYDPGLSPQALISCYDLPVSLYEFEFEVV